MGVATLQVFIEVTITSSTSLLGWQECDLGTDDKRSKFAILHARKWYGGYIPRDCGQPHSNSPIIPRLEHARHDVSNLQESKLDRWREQCSIIIHSLDSPPAKAVIGRFENPHKPGDRAVIYCTRSQVTAAPLPAPTQQINIQF